MEEGTVSSDNAWLQVDLGATYKLDQVDYTPRYYNDAKNYWHCTGNIKNLIVEIRKDGADTWTPVTGENGLDLSDKIVNKNDQTRQKLHLRHRKLDMYVSVERLLITGKQLMKISILQSVILRSMERK